MRPVILVIDDDTDIRLLLRVNLEIEGWRVEEASDAAEPDWFRTGENVPDVIVLDVRLAGNGLGYLTKLRLHPTLHAVPVIMLSGDSGTSREEAESLGVSAYWKKPFSPIELCAFIRVLLEEQK